MLKTQSTYSFALNSDLSAQATLITNNTIYIKEKTTTLNNNLDQSNNYTKTEIITLIETQYTVNGSFIKIVDPVSGKVEISLNTSNIPIHIIFTVVRTDEIKASTSQI